MRNLAPLTTEAALRALFARIGEVLDVRIFPPSGRGEPSTYGFVTMSALSEADTAVSRLHDQLFNGLKLKVTLAHPRLVHGGIRPI